MGKVDLVFNGDFVYCLVVVVIVFLVVVQV